MDFSLDISLPENVSPLRTTAPDSGNSGHVDTHVGNSSISDIHKKNPTDSVIVGVSKSQKKRRKHSSDDNCSQCTLIDCLERLGLPMKFHNHIVCVS